MNRTELLRVAKAKGLVDPNAHWPDSRPWPVVLMTALGAWLAAFPLLGAAGALFGAVFERSLGLYGVGVAALALAVWLLRERGQPLFVEQLGVPTLLAGLLCIGVRLAKDLPDRWAAVAMALLCLALAAPLGRTWLRMLLGAAAAGLGLAALHGGGWPRQAVWPWVLVMQGAVVGLWWTRWREARVAAWAEAIGNGAVGVLLAALALDAGMSWLVGGLGPVPWNWTHHLHGGGWGAGAAAVALGVAAVLAWRWPLLRTLRWAACAVLLALASALLPPLAGVAVIAGTCALQQRWRWLGASALTALWVLGSFYYRLDWDLQSKALALVALSAVLAAVARWSVRALPPIQPEPETLTRSRSLALLVATAAGLAVINVGILQKERLLAQGEPLFVELAPVDPRSLMQGDYMRLNYALLRSVGEWPPRPGAQRPQVVLKRDAQGVGHFVRRAEGPAALASDERLLELSPKDGRWTVVSDAWFFREGEATRWQAARYAELRVLPDGRALLVGLRGEGQKAL
ncbi:GDYXXLXY domain-containing protein [Inhella gelatinilytica]|uniref:GDYXXLXY domain-containing protein n=1 Tax=Inhella gelatinilytica TaxID=2795030 RepID=A0A931IYS6_9BURK|nr:GDYXXLXY domain-containing protein [Inhella gelatinilytica]MBH9553574.1 GDYXXLXY domain-containing protein [Inhella gelatinilytica]